jgi:wyosine [tRNA(Phe)-imidazoG37] synthetase (radical SAM superfamily)
VTYIYGPIPSRRLGQSLGVDTIPLKTCNWNCVYCQLGRSTPVVHERAEYAPRAAILAELDQVLGDRDTGLIDWITFVGSGEPTLHSSIGWLIRAVKSRTTIPTAVITNGSLLYLPEVRAELAAADAVMPTLSTASPTVYRRLHRPHPAATFARLVDGLAALRQEYAGKIWIEVMLVHGLNDDTPGLQALAALLADLRPDEVHLTLPTRPPAEPWVMPTDDEGLMRAVAILGQNVHVVHPQGGRFALDPATDPVEEILNIVVRHPMSDQQVRDTLATCHPDRVDQIIAWLTADPRAGVIERNGVAFWTVAQAVFPETVPPRGHNEVRIRPVA